MSRFSDDYYDGEYDAFITGGWEAAKERALKGKRGLKVLQEMLKALQALPSPRLIADYVVKDGEVCAVGAYARYKGKDLSYLDGDDFFGGNETANLGEDCGMQRTIAWTLANLNDERFSKVTPEQRYAGIYNWVSERIEENPYYHTEAVAC